MFIMQEEYLLEEFKKSYFFTVYDFLKSFYDKKNQTINCAQLFDLKNFVLDKLNGNSLSSENHINFNHVLARLTSYQFQPYKLPDLIFYADDFIALLWAMMNDSTWESNPTNAEQNKIVFVNKLSEAQIDLSAEIPISNNKNIFEAIGKFALDMFGIIDICADNAKLSQVPHFIRQKIIGLLEVDCKAYKANPPDKDFTAHMTSFINGLKEALEDFFFEEDDSLYRKTDIKKVFTALYSYMEDKTLLAKNYHELENFLDKLEFLIHTCLKHSNIWELIGAHHELQVLLHLGSLNHILYNKTQQLMRCIVQSLDPLRPNFNAEFVEEIINKPQFEDFIPKVKVFHQSLENSSALTQKRKEMATLECELKALKYLLENHLISEKLAIGVSHIQQLNNYASIFEKKSVEVKKVNDQLLTIATKLADQMNLPNFVDPLLASTSERIKRCEKLLKEISQLVFYVQNRNYASLFESKFPVEFVSIDGTTPHVFKNDVKSWALNFLRVAFLREQDDILLKDFVEISRLIHLLKREDRDFQKEVLTEVSDLLRFHNNVIMSRQKFDIQNFMDLIFRQHDLDLKLFIRKEDIIQKFTSWFNKEDCEQIFETAHCNILPFYDNQKFEAWREFFINKLAADFVINSERSLEKMTSFMLLTLFNNISVYSPKKLLINKTLYEFGDNLHWLCKIYLMPEENYINNSIIQPLNVTKDLRTVDFNERVMELCKHFAWLSLAISRMPEPFKECCLTLYSREESSKKLLSIAEKYSPKKSIFNLRLSNQTPGAVAFEIKHPSDKNVFSSKLDAGLGQNVQNLKIGDVEYTSSDLFPVTKLFLENMQVICIYGNGRFHADIKAEEVNTHRKGYINMLELVTRNSNRGYVNQTLHLMSDLRQAKPSMKEEETSTYAMQV